MSAGAATATGGPLLALGVVVRSATKLTSDDEESGKDKLGEVHHLCWWGLRERERERCGRELFDEVYRAESSRGRYWGEMTGDREGFYTHTSTRSAL